MPRRPSATLILVLAAAGPAGCDSHAAAERAYAAGRFEDAARILAERVAAAGDDASAELLWNRALAALRAGDLGAAESSVRAAAARADTATAADADFLAGNISFARAELAEAQARTPEAEPFAFDVALASAEAARRSWLLAATTRDDWPEARRNVERALAKIDDLRRQKDEKERSRRKEREPGPGGTPRPAPTAAEAPPAEDPAARRAGGGTADDGSVPGAATEEISREDVLRLFERLAAKERERAEVRQAEQRAKRTPTGKDW